MIRINLGKVGSGKTVCEVREMALNLTNRKYYSNIKTTLSQNMVIKPEMICKKETVKNSKGKEEKKLVLNVDYWKGIKESISVIIDEAHSVMNARRSMHKANILITDWLALIRRVLGESESGSGELVLITQLPYRIDSIARDMANEIRYHICHYIKSCKKCGYGFWENSEVAERLFFCPYCASPDLKKHNHIIEVLKFDSMRSYEDWHFFKANSFYKRYIITDIEQYFVLYDTLQWDNLFSSLY